MAVWLNRPAPTPFVTKLPIGTPINWMDPLSANLVACWGFLEGQGTYLKDSAFGDKRLTDYSWGPDRISGLGTNIPHWDTHDKAMALYSVGSVTPATPLGGGHQQILPAYTNTTPGTTFPFKNGITLEFWAQSDGVAGTEYGMISAHNVSTGAAFSLGVYTDPRVFLQGNVNTAYSAIYGSYATMPNHWVGTLTTDGVGKLYANGQLVSTNTICNAPFFGLDCEFIHLCRDERIPAFSDTYTGWVYKASVYAGILGDAAIQALALNPMRVFQTPRYPGIFGGNSLQVYQSYQLLEYVDGIVPPSPPAYPPPPDVPPQTTPPGTTGPPPRTPPVTPGFAPGFRLFQRDTEIRIKPWGSTESYSLERPIGGKHFTGGSDGGAGGADI